MVKYVATFFLAHFETLGASALVSSGNQETMANSMTASRSRRYVARSHTQQQPTSRHNWRQRRRCRRKQHQPEELQTDNASRSVVSWTILRTLGTCPLLLTVSAHKRTPQCVARNMADVPHHSRSRKVHPHRLARPACRYYLSCQGW